MLIDNIPLDTGKLHEELQRCRTALIRAYSWLEDYPVFDDAGQQAKNSMLEEIRTAVQWKLRHDD